MGNSSSFFISPSEIHQHAAKHRSTPNHPVGVAEAPGRALQLLAGAAATLQTLVENLASLQRGPSDLDWKKVNGKWHGVGMGHHGSSWIMMGHHGSWVNGWFNLVSVCRNEFHKHVFDVFEPRDNPCIFERFELVWGGDFSMKILVKKSTRRDPWGRSGLQGVSPLSTALRCDDGGGMVGLCDLGWEVADLLT